jgi:hypothetical protein
MSTTLGALASAQFPIRKGDIVEVSGSGEAIVSFTGWQKRVRILATAQSIGPYEADGDLTIVAGLVPAVFSVSRERETAGGLPVTYNPETQQIIAGGEAIGSGSGQVGQVGVSVSRALTDADVNKQLMCDTSGGAIVLTIPDDESAEWRAGPKRIFKYQSGSNLASFAAGAGVTLRNPFEYESQQYATEGIQYVGADEWAFF